MALFRVCRWCSEMGAGGGAVRQCSQPGSCAPVLRPSVLSVLRVASFLGIVDSNAQLEPVSESYYREKEIFVQKDDGTLFISCHGTFLGNPGYHIHMLLPAMLNGHTSSSGWKPSEFWSSAAAACGARSEALQLPERAGFSRELVLAGFSREPASVGSFLVPGLLKN
uniref:Uncharacterized protein n=1 Tax=Triticum aestivum TaxID=4565 RepID=A0A0B4SV49_WHEAT|nr:hypothetical protein [Triticum aestivum]